MNPFFLILYIFIIAQRLAELSVANRNSRWIQARGGLEAGQDHYKYIVLIHVGFLASLFIEVAFFGAKSPVWWTIPFSLFVIAQVLRYWCILSLGKFWNTRIFTLQKHPIVKKGPYRWLKHPNYVIVTTELVVFPLIFGAYITATVWSAINLLFLLFVRIPTEERALKMTSEHQK